MVWIFSRTVVFGTIADVRHYNISPRIDAALACGILWIAIVRYFGDFAASIPACLRQKALGVFNRFCSILGLLLKAEKYQVCARITFLGVEGLLFFTSQSNEDFRSANFRASCQLGRHHRDFLRKGRVGRNDSGILVGRLGA